VAYLCTLIFASSVLLISASSLVLQDLFAAIVNDDPVWFAYSDEHYVFSLSDVPASVLTETARFLPAAFTPKRRNRGEAVIALLAHFLRMRAELTLLNDQSLSERHPPCITQPLPSVCRLLVISGYLEAYPEP
jgi:hypothetical protein